MLTTKTNIAIKLGQLAIAFSFVLVSNSAWAQAAPYTIDGTTLKTGSTTIALPCAPSEIVIEAPWLLGTCGTSVLVVSLANPSEPKPVAVHNGAEFFKVGSVTWIKTSAGSTPLKSWERLEVDNKPFIKPNEEKVEIKPKLEPKESETPIPEAPIPEPALIIGNVIQIEPGFALIDIGTEQGIDDDAHIEFFVRESVDFGDGERVEKLRKISVGKVETASENRARVALGLNELVEKGVFARPTELPLSKRPWVPRRVDGVWSASFIVRPLLALSTLGGGAIVDGEITYRFQAPFSLSFKLLPFGFGLAKSGDVLTFAGNVFGSYDTTAFEVGLGLGATKVNTFSAGPRSEFVLTKPVFRTGFSMAQFVRLGSFDGLHLSVINNFVLFNDEFSFGGVTIEGFIPLRLFVDNAWLLARGGGGVPGHLFGEIGLRLLASGNGGPGSMFLTTTGKNSLPVKVPKAAMYIFPPTSHFQWEPRSLTDSVEANLATAGRLSVLA